MKGKWTVEVRDRRRTDHANVVGLPGNLGLREALAVKVMGRHLGLLSISPSHQAQLRTRRCGASELKGWGVTVQATAPEDEISAAEWLLVMTRSGRENGFREVTEGE